MYYNPNQFVNHDMSHSFYRYPNSVIYPRFNTSIRKVSTLNLGKILETTQRGINTINQIVPIYKQISPVIKKVSAFTKSFSGLLFRKSNNQIFNTQVEKTTNTNDSYRTNTTPNNPYFK